MILRRWDMPHRCLTHPNKWKKGHNSKNGAIENLCNDQRTTFSSNTCVSFNPNLYYLGTLAHINAQAANREPRASPEFTAIPACACVRTSATRSLY